jgi:DNA-binding FadR family transcriptional regulator
LKPKVWCRFRHALEENIVVRLNAATTLLGDVGIEGARPRGTHRRPEKISEVVAREIVHDMRRLPTQTMLPPESVMLDKYRVGRASLREALRILEVQGLIIIRPGPGGGPMVAPVESRHFARMASLYLHLSDATYRDVIEARLVMEPVMARLAAEREDHESLAGLEQFVAAAPTDAADVEYLSHSTEFHAVLSGLSGNPVLDFMGRALKDIYHDRLASQIFPANARQRVQADHTAIARAIVKGNASRAERLMREHMIEFVTFSSARNPAVLDEVVDWR